jgi:hypothetical protein
MPNVKSGGTACLRKPPPSVHPVNPVPLSILALSARSASPREKIRSRLPRPPYSGLAGRRRVRPPSSPRRGLPAKAGQASTLGRSTRSANPTRAGPVEICADPTLSEVVLSSVPGGKRTSLSTILKIRTARAGGGPPAPNPATSPIPILGGGRQLKDRPDDEGPSSLDDPDTAGRGNRFAPFRSN